MCAPAPEEGFGVSNLQVICSFSKTISFISQLFDHSCWDCTSVLFIYFYPLENNLVDMSTSSDEEETPPDLAGLNDHHGSCPVELPCALP